MAYFHELCFDKKKGERMEGKNLKKTESCELRRWRKRKLLNELEELWKEEEEWKKEEEE